MPQSTISNYHVLVEQAIAADHAHDYNTALVLYRTAIGMLLEKMEQNRRKKNAKEQQQELKRQVKDLLRRAEQLQVYLAHSNRKDKVDCCQQNQIAKVVRVNNATSNADHEDDNDRSGKEADQEREWSFNFNLKFDMKSKLKTPACDPSKDNSGTKDSKDGGGYIISILRMLRLLR